MKKVIEELAVAAAAAILLGAIMYFKSTGVFHGFDWRLLII